MTNIISYLVANTYTGITPIVNVATAVCQWNGEEIPCNSVPGLSTVMATFGVMMLIYFILIVFMVVTMWKLYAKAGKPGWASIIPIYNLVVMLEIVGKPIWWIIMMFIPFVNIIFGIIIAHQTSKVFGKDVGFTIGLIILPIIFYPILAFGRATYLNPNNSLPTPPTPAMV